MSGPNIRPLGQNVLLRRLEAESTTKGGIILPDTAKEKPREGEVLALGEGALFVGDVHFAKSIPFALGDFASARLD